MLGQRKKIHKEEVSQKKKWELELAVDEDAINIDPKEIPKQDSEDEKMQQNQELLENSLKRANKNEEITQNLNISGEKKKKIYEWMDSSDEFNDEKSKDDNSEVEDEGHSKTLHKAQEKSEKIVKLEDLEDRDSRTIFVNNLSFEMTAKEIEHIFKKYGKIINLEIPKNEGAVLNKGRAFIEYSSVKEAKNALEFNNTWLKGRNIQCTLGLIKATSLALEEKKNKPNKISQTFPKNKNDNQKKRNKKNNSSSSNSSDDKRSSSNSSSPSRSRSRSNSNKVPRRKK